MRFTVVETTAGEDVDIPRFVNEGTGLTEDDPIIVGASVEDTVIRLVVRIS